MNVIPMILGLIETKYRSDAALVAMADALMLAQRQAATVTLTGYSEMNAYQRGAQGDDGYSTPSMITGSMFDRAIKEATYLYEVTVITRLIVVALQRMGEEIEY